MRISAKDIKAVPDKNAYISSNKPAESTPTSSDTIVNNFEVEALVKALESIRSSIESPKDDNRLALLLKQSESILEALSQKKENVVNVEVRQDEKLLSALIDKFSSSIEKLTTSINNRPDSFQVDIQRDERGFMKGALIKVK